MEGLAVPFNAIQKGIETIMKWLSDIFSSIGNIATSILSGVGNLFSTLWNWLEDILLSIGNIVDGILDGISGFFSTLWTWLKDIFTLIFNIPSTIIELLSDLLKFLFVPDNNPFENLSSKFNEKFAFVNQAKDLFNSLIGFNNYGNSAPTFNMTWKGVTFAFIDFSMFLQYRLWLHGVILAIAWFIFIRRTVNRLPAIIGAFGGANYDN